MTHKVAQQNVDPNNCVDNIYSISRHSSIYCAFFKLAVGAGYSEKTEEMYKNTLIIPQHYRMSEWLCSVEWVPNVFILFIYNRWSSTHCPFIMFSWIYISDDDKLQGEVNHFLPKQVCMRVCTRVYVYVWLCALFFVSDSKGNYVMDEILTYTCAFCQHTHV